MLHVQTLNLQELVAQAEQWDDLWKRSEVRLPTVRAGGIELWCDCFAAGADLEAIVVTDHNRWVAGLPLIKQRSRWPLTVYRLPADHTVRAGDYLVDPSCDVAAVSELMAAHVGELPGAVAAFEGIDIDSDRWRQLINGLQASGRAVHQSDGNEVGVVDILHDWQGYQQSWSRNHRSAVKRSRKKLESSGTLSVERLREPTDEQLREVMESCFAIEDRSWKGENGTSIVRTPGLAAYYQAEARLMRSYGTLDLWLLKLDDRIIAFEYCHFSKSTCFSHKISFDPEFQQFSPGRVLRCLQLERYHDDPNASQLDTLGLLCEAKAKWVTRTYRSSRCFVAIGNPASNLCLRGFKGVRSVVKRVRQRKGETATIEPGAARYLETARPAEPREVPALVAPMPALGTMPPQHTS